MSCACFTCQLHASDVISEEDKIFAECIYYATSIKDEQYTLNLLKSLGIKSGSLGDEGASGEMRAIEANIEFDMYGLQELLPYLSDEQTKLVEAIYKIKE